MSFQATSPFQRQLMTASKMVPQNVTVENFWWLDSYSDCCGIRLETVLSSGIALMNLNGEGDFKLVVADLVDNCSRTKLKVANSTGPLCTEAVYNLVVALTPVIMDETDSGTTTLAIACGECLLFYRNMKPFFRLTINDQEVAPIEEQIWHNANDTNVPVEQVMKALTYLRSQLSFSQMSTQSQTYFTLKDDESRRSFIKVQKGEKLKCTTSITCMGSMKKSVDSSEDVDWLIVGTEHGKLVVVDSQLLIIQWTLQLPGKPCFIGAYGAHNQEHGILVCCRNNTVYKIKRTTKKTSTKAIISLQCATVGMVVSGEYVAIGTMDDRLTFYTKSGKELWTKKLSASIITMNSMPYPQKNFFGVLVALANRTVRVYKEEGLCNVITVDDVVTALCFGRFGHEKGALIMVMSSGSLRVKLLRKNAKLTDKVMDDKATTAAEQLQKSTLPKMSKLFIDQTNRERDNAPAIHEHYQKGLLELRIATAGAYVAMLKKKMKPITDNVGSDAQKETLSLSAQVIGLGPKFCFEIYLSSVAKELRFNFIIVILHDTNIYKFDTCRIEVPVILPNNVHKFKTNFQIIREQLSPANVVLSVRQENASEPLQMACITMPSAALTH